MKTSIEKYSDIEEKLEDNDELLYNGCWRGDIVSTLNIMKEHGVVIDKNDSRIKKVEDFEEKNGYGQ